MNHRRFEPGTVLADKYRLDALLGEGGMGTVYRATHLLLKAPVAIKVIDREVSSGDVALARFMREAQAAAALRSPHVVQVLDYGSAEGSPFMVMELLEGENLAQRIERAGRLTPGETYRVMSHVARAVAKAHEAGIVHRDLKPDNVFLVHNEGDELAKVLDFGVAKVEATALGGGSHTRTGSLLGTPYYMSPEQAQGNKEVDHRSDLWALAVIAFECLTGKRPFFSDGLGDIVLQICVRDIPRPSSVGDVPAGFDDWFFHATKREPQERFQSARELSEALREALEIQREPASSVPESQWSAAPSLPLPRLATPSPPDVATERDEVKADALTMHSSPGSADVGSSPRASQPSPSSPSREAPVPAPTEPLLSGQRGARWEESVPRGDAPVPENRWKVVPVGPSDRPPKAAARAESEPPRPTRLLGVVLVAAVALSLGAGLVMLAREYGSEFVARTLRGETTVKLPKAKAAPHRPPKAAATGTAIEEKGNEAKSSGVPRKNAVNSGSGAPEEDDEAQVEQPDEDDVLDEIEEGLDSEVAPDGGTEPREQPAVRPTAPADDPERPDAPRPEVPEGLIPPPPPPAPTPDVSPPSSDPK